MMEIPVALALDPSVGVARPIQLTRCLSCGDAIEWDDVMTRWVHVTNGYIVCGLPASHLYRECS